MPRRHKLTPEEKLRRQKEYDRRAALREKAEQREALRAAREVEPELSGPEAAARVVDLMKKIAT